MSTNAPDWNELAQKLDDLIADGSNWERPASGSNAKQTLCRPAKSKMGYKAQYWLACSMEELVELVSDTKRRTEWDTFCTEAELLAEDPKVIYYRTHSRWPISAREEVRWSGKIQKDGKVYLLSTGCTSDRYKVRGDGVKMTTKVSGMIIEKQQDGCRIVQVFDTDPGGRIPGPISKRIAVDRVPKMIKKLDSLLGKQ
jgi:hypothetical protein